MHDSIRTYQELIEEISILKQRNHELEKAEAEHKRAEEAMSDTETRYRMLFEHSPDGIVIIDPATARPLEFNETAHRQLGFSREEFQRLSISDIDASETSDETRSRIQKVITEGRSDFETIHRTREGEIRNIHVTAQNTVLSGRSVYHCIWRDITERKQAEETLRESEEKHRLLVENSHDIIYTLTTDGVFTFVSPSWTTLLGHQITQVVGQPYQQFVHPDDLAGCIIFMQSVIETGQRQEGVEYRVRHGNGSWYWHTSSAVPLRGRDGTITGFEGIARDITTQKQLEEKLKSSEERYRSIFETILDVYYRTDEVGNFTLMSPSGFLLLGYDSPTELLGKRVSDTIYMFPEDRNKLLEIIQETGQALDYEVTLKHRDGMPIEVSTSSHFYYDRDGSILGVEGIFRDIRDRKCAEQEVIKQKEFEKSILSSVPHALFGVEHRRIFFANEAMKNVFGWDPQELIGKSTRILFRNENDWEAYGERLYDLLEKHEVVSFEPENHFVRKDGKEIDCRNSVSRIGENLSEGNRIIATFEDITERKQIEKELSREQLLIQTLLDSLPGIFYVYSYPELRLIRWNINHETLLGFGSGEIKDRPILEWHIPDAKEAVLEAVENVMKKGQNMIESSLLTKDGRSIPFALSGVKLEVLGQTYLVGVGIDITERKQAEEALRASQQIIEGIINTIPMRVFWKDKNLTFLGCNKAFARDAGFADPKDIIGKDDYQMVWRDQAELYRGDDRQVIATGCPKLFIEEPQETPEGNIITLLTSKIPLCNSNGEISGVLGTYMDITELKQAEEDKRKLEERLQRAEKMEALGLLSGGVAHDLNNVLGILFGYAELLLLGIEESSPVRPYAANIMNASERAGAIIQDMLTLARRGVQTRKVINLNTLIRDFMKTPEYERITAFHPSVRIETSLETAPLNIMGSPHHIGKTIMNLFNNAVEAMPNGGLLTISTSNRYMDRPVQGYDEVREGDYVVLCVSDLGEGISENDIKHIFEPFYTKKVMGKSGTGLGLAVVWGTVKDHDGYIDVQTEEGKGSAFSLYFPVTREELSEERIAISMAEYMGQDESLLVVDDVEGQRELAARMLEKLNYRVDIVASGEEAVAYLKDHRADLVVLDMIMDPGMDGLDTYRKILEIHPQQKAIIVSGFSETERIRQAQALGAGAYVKKPYVMEKLGLAVRKEIERSAGIQGH